MYVCLRFFSACFVALCSLFVWYLHEIYSLYLPLLVCVCAVLCCVSMSMFSFAQLFNNIQTEFLFAIMLCIIHKTKLQHLMWVIIDWALAVHSRYNNAMKRFSGGLDEYGVIVSRWIFKACKDYKQPNKMQLFGTFFFANVCDLLRKLQYKEIARILKYFPIFTVCGRICQKCKLFLFTP